MLCCVLIIYYSFNHLSARMSTSCSSKLGDQDGSSNTEKAAATGAGCYTSWVGSCSWPLASAGTDYS